MVSGFVVIFFVSLFVPSAPNQNLVQNSVTEFVRVCHLTRSQLILRWWVCANPYQFNQYIWKKSSWLLKVIKNKQTNKQTNKTPDLSHSSFYSICIFLETLLLKMLFGNILLKIKIQPVKFENLTSFIKWLMKWTAFYLAS